MASLSMTYDATIAASFAPHPPCRAPSPRERGEGQAQSSAGCFVLLPTRGEKVPEGRMRGAFTPQACETACETACLSTPYDE